MDPDQAQHSIQSELDPSLFVTLMVILNFFKHDKLPSMQRESQDKGSSKELGVLPHRLRKRFPVSRIHLLAAVNKEEERNACYVLASMEDASRTF